ncbi:RnfABCDGE type electron transport complex subunit B [Megasphaera sp.]|jgi:Na+-translocating ferredoxin:NAD+ oxidoreductase RNF subunit RnfB|uniref:RnfABCDGE type electron transport complex subunit B n=1 Tax=Megasphaera sueciensis TaxID=349094 RepID=UPI002ACB08CD|nr:Fe-S cluster domain-containing protein [Megasphaera sp.]
MDYTQIAIMAVVIMTGVGVVFGFVLALADKKFAMEENPLIGEVEEALPKGQCGACGFAGCAKYAEAVVLDPEVPPNLCVPGKAEVAAVVANLTGKVAEATEPKYAHIRCRGGVGIAKLAFNYKGVHDCAAAKLVQQGPKECKYGCLGFGNCVKACPFGAMSMGENGIPVVNKSLCTGCGKCASICPQHVIELIPISAKVTVSCSSKEMGAAARKACTAACIGCGLCMKNCTHKGGVKVVDHLAIVDPSICRICDDLTCVDKCPTNAIAALVARTKKEENVG